MADLIFLGVIVVFFAICVGYVRACDRMIVTARVGVDEHEEVAG